MLNGQEQQQLASFPWKTGSMGPVGHYPGSLQIHTCLVLVQKGRVTDTREMIRREGFLVNPDQGLESRPEI